MSGEGFGFCRVGVPMQAKPLLEALVREALLGSRFHGVMFDDRTMDFLLDHFLNHDFNVAFFRRGLQVCDSITDYFLVCMPHLRQQCGNHIN